MRGKIESLNNYDAIKSDYDVLALLKETKAINFKFGLVYYANKRFYSYKQSAKDTNNEHYDKFNNLVSVVESYGGLLGQEELLLEGDDEYSQLSDTEKKLSNNI